LLGAGSALLANLTGAQFAAKVALHGMAGGVMSTMGGGKFGHGFASAAGTQLSSVMIDQIGNGAASYKAHRIMAAAVVGGTIAEVIGGKFANGAVTGAFSRAFNDERHGPSLKDVEHVVPEIQKREAELLDTATVGAGNNCVDLGIFLIPEIGPASGWAFNRHVTENSYIERGTLIATPVDGRYPTNPGGPTGHLAVYLYHTADRSGIVVMDQGPGMPEFGQERIIERTIPFRSTTPAALRNPLPNEARHFYTLKRNSP